MHIISRAPHTHTYSIAGTNLGFVQVYSDYLVDIDFDLNHGGGGGGGGGGNTASIDMTIHCALKNTSIL